MGGWNAGRARCAQCLFRAHRHTGVRRRKGVEEAGELGLAPVSIGLTLAGCFTMAKGAIIGLETGAIAVEVLIIPLQYKINPALLVVASAVVGLLTFIPK
jgi:hypothetical protein